MKSTLNIARIILETIEDEDKDLAIAQNPLSSQSTLDQLFLKHTTKDPNSFTVSPLTSGTNKYNIIHAIASNVGNNDIDPPEPNGTSPKTLDDIITYIRNDRQSHYGDIHKDLHPILATVGSNPNASLKQITYAAGLLPWHADPKHMDSIINNDSLPLHILLDPKLNEAEQPGLVKIATHYNTPLELRKHIASVASPHSAHEISDNIFEGDMHPDIAANLYNNPEFKYPHNISFNRRKDLPKELVDHAVNFLKNFYDSETTDPEQIVQDKQMYLNRYTILEHPHVPPEDIHELTQKAIESGNVNDPALDSLTRNNNMRSDTIDMLANEMAKGVGLKYDIALHNVSKHPNITSNAIKLLVKTQGDVMKSDTLENLKDNPKTDPKTNKKILRLIKQNRNW